MLIHPIQHGNWYQDDSLMVAVMPAFNIAVMFSYWSNSVKIAREHCDTLERDT